MTKTFIRLILYLIGVLLCIGEDKQTAMLGGFVVSFIASPYVEAAIKKFKEEEL